MRRRQHPLFVAWAVAALFAGMALPAQAQIYRCQQPGSGFVLQQTPCPPGVWGSRVDDAPGQRPPPPPPRPRPPPYPQPYPYPYPVYPDGGYAPPAFDAPAYRSADEAERLRQQRQPSGGAGSQLSREADLCLDWYRALIRDPSGVYYSGPVKEGRVLSFTLHIPTTGYRGAASTDTREAACEIWNGQLDAGWTKIHAERRGWY